MIGRILLYGILNEMLGESEVSCQRFSRVQWTEPLELRHRMSLACWAYSALWAEVRFAPRTLRAYRRQLGSYPETGFWDMELGHLTVDSCGKWEA